MSRVLVIGDLHVPAEHPGYFEFIRRIQREYKTTQTVQIGDVIDHQASSFHESDPDLESAGSELKEAKKHLAKWFKAFPKLSVTLGNHDLIPARKLKTLGVSKFYLRALGDVVGAPKTWSFVNDLMIDGVLYKHTPQGSTLTGLLRGAERNTCSTVTGHLHSLGGVAYSCGYKYRVFAMAAGCGVDRKHPAMAYGANNTFKPLLGCGVVIEGKYAIYRPMELPNHE